MLKVLGIVALVAVVLLALSIAIRIISFLFWVGLVLLIVAAIAFLIGRLTGSRRT